MKLYHSKLSRSGRVLWLLEELGVPYELESLDLAKGENKSAAYRKVHPHGVVPALVDGAQTLIESGAICAYLADKYADKGLAPGLSSPARGKYYQWILYTVATMEPPILMVFMNTSRLPEGERNAAVAEAGRSQFKEVARVLTGALDGKEYLVDDRFSVADIMVGSTLVWCQFLGLLADEPVLREYVARLSQRPAFKKSNSL